METAWSLRRAALGPGVFSDIRSWHAWGDPPGPCTGPRGRGTGWDRPPPCVPGQDARQRVGTGPRAPARRFRPRWWRVFLPMPLRHRPRL